MKKILLTILSLGLFFTTSTTTIFAQETPVNETTQINSSLDVVMFYGEGCPHCAKVERAIEVLKDNKYTQINFVIYEIYHNSDNQKKFLTYSQKFGFPTDGVPVTIIGEDYFIGEDYEKLNELLEKCTATICPSPLQTMPDYNNDSKSTTITTNNTNSIVGWIIIITLFAFFIIIIISFMRKKKTPINN